MASTSDSILSIRGLRFREDVSLSAECTLSLGRLLVTVSSDGSTSSLFSAFAGGLQTTSLSVSSSLYVGATDVVSELEARITQAAADARYLRPTEGGLLAANLTVDANISISGSLYVDGADIVAELDGKLTQAAVAGIYLPLTGGTLVGSLVAPALSAGSAVVGQVQLADAQAIELGNVNAARAADVYSYVHAEPLVRHISVSSVVTLSAGATPTASFVSAAGGLYLLSLGIPAGVGSEISAQTIGDGSVTNDAFQHLSGASANIQAQLNGKLTQATGDARYYTFDTDLSVHGAVSISDALVVGTTDIVQSLASKLDEVPLSTSATRIANGSVSNEAFQYIAGVTSDVQAQLQGKFAGTGGAISGDVSLAGQLTVKGGTSGGWRMGGSIGPAAATGAGIIVDGLGSPSTQYTMAVTSSGAEVWLNASSVMRFMAGATEVARYEPTYVQSSVNTRVAGALSASGVATLSELSVGEFSHPLDSSWIANGAVTNTAFQHLSGVTSNVQTQLDARLSEVPANTSATRIADGSITNAMFQHLSGAAANLQTQLNARLTQSSADARYLQTAGGAIGGDVSVGGALYIGVVNVASALEAKLDEVPNNTPATRIADGSVGNTEFAHLNGVTAPIQTQLNSRPTLTAADARYHQIGQDLSVQGAVSISGALVVGTTNIGTSLARKLEAVPANTSAALIANGSVDNATYQHLSGVSANIQQQLNTKLTQVVADTRYVVVTGDTMTGDLAIDGSLSTATLYVNTTNILDELAQKLSELPSGTSATRIANGSVDNATFQHLSGVTSNLQTQITSRPTLTTADARYHQFGQDLSVQGAVSISGALVVGTTNITTALASKLEAVPANTSAGLIADGSVDSATYQHLSGVSANIQQQLETKLTQAIADTRYVTVTGDSMTGDLVVDGSISTAALFVDTTNVLDELAKKLAQVPSGTSATLIANGSVDDATFQHLSGVTSNLQTQLDARLSSVPANTDASLIADGTVSNVEFQYLNGATAPLQTQLNTKLTQSSGDGRYVRLDVGGNVDGVLSTAQLHGTSVTIATASSLVPTAGDVHDYVHGTFVLAPLSISTTAGGVLSSGALATAGALFAGIAQLADVYVQLSGGGAIMGDLSISGSIFIDSLDVASAITLRLTEAQGDARYIQDLSVGTVTTLSAGATATATIVEDGSLRILNLGLPEGDTGGITIEEADLRYIQDLSIGNVTTVPNGSPASATATWVDGVYVLDLALPQGEAGGLSEAQADELYLALSGGEMVGDVTVDADVSLSGGLTAATLSVGAAQCDTVVITSLSIGTLTSNVQRASQASFAFGYNAGLTSQGIDALAVGHEAGQTQSSGAVAIGYRAGRTSQSNNTVAVGVNAGLDTQGTNAIAMGNAAGRYIQGSYSVAIGSFAGDLSQGGNAVAVGRNAGQSYQGGGSVAIGNDAGRYSLGNETIAIGSGSGRNTGIRAVTIGMFAGISAAAHTVAIGTNAGIGAGSTNVAIGMNAQNSNAADAAVAIGRDAGNHAQGLGAVGLGRFAGYLSQGAHAVALGSYAGYNSQHTRSVVLNATGSALDSQQADACYVKPVREASASNMLFYDATTGEITYSATAGGLSAASVVTSGDVTVGSGVSTGGAVTVGGVLSAAALDDLDTRLDALEADSYISTSGAGVLNGSLSVSGVVTVASISIGTITSSINQPHISASLAIGFFAGATAQQPWSIAIGSEAGQSQSSGSVAIGKRAGRVGQSSNAVAIGYESARNSQGTNAVAIGNLAGIESQGVDSIALGFYAGAVSQGGGCVALGRQAGQTNQGAGAIALGTFAGIDHQGTLATAVGNQSGFVSQGASAVAFGYFAGRDYQGLYAVAVGRDSGRVGQGESAVAIGYTAGHLSQGEFSIAIGYTAGRNNQHERSIVLDATGAVLDSQQTDAFYVKPVREASAARLLCYDLSTGEITHSTSTGDLASASLVTAGAVAVGGTLSAAVLDELDTRVNALEADSYISTSGAGVLVGSLSVSGAVTAATLLIGATNVATSLASKLEAVPPSTSATLIADGSVTNSMFQHLSGATSNLQVQLGDRYSKAQSDARYLLQTGGLVAGDMDVSGDLSVSNAVIIGTTNVLNALSAKLEAVPPSTSATLIADGSVSNTEFQFLNGVTAPIQTQLSTKLTQAGGDARYMQLTGGALSGDLAIAGSISIADDLIIGSTNILSELDLKLEAVPANISVQQLANGSVDNTTFQHLSGVSSNLQLQLAQKLTQAVADGRYLRTTGGELTGDLVVDGVISVSTALFIGSLNIVNEISGKLDDTQLSASRIGNGSVSNATYQHLSGTSSNIQQQLDNKLDGQGGAIDGDLSISGSITIDGGAVSTTLSTSTLNAASCTTGTLSVSTARVATTLSAASAAVGEGSFVTARVGKLSIGGLANDTAFDAAWIANGSIDNATFQHLSGVGTNVQGQLNALSVQVGTVTDELAAYNGDASVHFDMRSIALNSAVVLSTGSLPDKTNSTAGVVDALHLFNSIAMQPTTTAGVADVYRYTAQRIYGAKADHFVDTILQSRGLSVSGAMDHMWVEPDTDGTAIYHIGSYDYLGAFDKEHKRWGKVHIAAASDVNVSGQLNVRTIDFASGGTVQTGNVELLVLQSVSGSNTNAVSGKDVHAWYETQSVVKSLEIGSITALVPGSTPVATLSTANGAYALHLGIPVGALVQASISVGVGVYGTLSAHSGVLQTLSVGTIYGALSDVPANTDAAKIADGSVSNTEYQYLNGVTEPLQVQLDRKIEESVSGTLSISSTLTAATLSASVATIDAISCSGRLTTTELSVGTLLSALNAGWIADGSVSNTRFLYLANLTADVQQQLDALSAADSLYLPLAGGSVAGGVSVAGRATLATLSIGSVVSSINAAWVGDGSVSNTEFQQLRNVTADVQAQFDALSAADTFKLGTGGGEIKGALSISGAVTMQSTLSVAGKLRVGGTGVSSGAEIEGYLDVGLGANKLRIGEPIGYNWSGNFDQVGIKSTLYSTFLLSMHEATGRTFVNSPDWLTLASADVTMIDMTTVGDIRFYRPMDVQAASTFREPATAQKWVVLSTSGSLATSGDSAYRAVHGKGVYDFATSTFLPLTGGALTGALSVASVTVSSALSVATVRTSSTPVESGSDIVPTAGDVYAYTNSTFVTAPLSISSTAGGVAGSDALITSGAVWSGFDALEYLPLSGGTILGALSIAGPLVVGSTNVLSELDQKLEAVPDATLIADGSVTNTAFQYIANLTADAQAQLDAFGVTDARNSPGMTLYIPSSITAPNRVVHMNLRVHTGESQHYLMGYSFALRWDHTLCTLNNITVGSESAPWDGVTITLRQPQVGVSVGAPLYRTYVVGSGFTTYASVDASGVDSFVSLPSIRVDVAQTTEGAGTVWNQPALPSYHFNKAQGSQLVATFEFNVKDDWVGLLECISGVWTKDFVDQDSVNYDSNVPHEGSGYIFSSFPDNSDHNAVPIRDITYTGTDVFTGFVQNGLRNQNSLVYNDRIVTPALYSGALSVSGNVSVGGQLQVNGTLLVGATNIVTELAGKQPSGSYLTEIPSGISVQKLANGSVDNSTFQHLSGVSSNLQTQLTNVRAVTNLISAGTHPNYYTRTELDASFALVDDELAEKHPLTGVTKTFTVADNLLHSVVSYSTVNSSAIITIVLDDVADPSILLTDGASFVFNSPAAVAGYSAFELSGRHVIASVVSFNDKGLRRVSSLTFAASTAATATTTVNAIGTISVIQYTNTANLASQLAISNHVATQVQKTCTRAEAYATFVAYLDIEDTVLSISDDRYLALSAASTVVTSVGDALYWSASNVAGALSTSSVTLGSTNIVTTNTSTTITLAVTSGTPAGYVAVGAMFEVSGITGDVRGIPAGELNGLHTVTAVLTDVTLTITGVQFEVHTAATSTDASTVSASMVFKRWGDVDVVPTSRAIDLRLGGSTATSLPLEAYAVSQISTVSGSGELLVQTDEAVDMTGALYVGCRVILSGVQDSVNGVSFARINGTHVVTALPAGTPLYDFYIDVSSSSATSTGAVATTGTVRVLQPSVRTRTASASSVYDFVLSTIGLAGPFSGILDDSLSVSGDVHCTSYKSFGEDPSDSNSTKGVIFDLGATSNYYDFGTNGNIPRSRPGFRLAQYHAATSSNHYIEYQFGGSSTGAGQVWYDLVPSTDNVYLLHGYKNSSGTYSTSNRTYKEIWWFAQECRLFANVTRAEGDMFKNGSTVVTSDSRVKKNIVNADSASAYETVTRVSIKEYDHNDPNIPHTPWGFIAQDVEAVYPGAVITDRGKFDSFGRSVIDTDTTPAQVAFEDKKMVNKDRLFQLLFSAFQHAQARISTLEAAVAHLTT